MVPFPSSLLMPRYFISPQLHLLLKAPLKPCKSAEGKPGGEVRSCSDSIRTAPSGPVTQSRRPSGWSSPAASGPAARWGHSPAAPAASGSKRASEGHQSLARTATSGARSASSQVSDKSPEQRAQPKAQACWFTRPLTKVLRHSTEPTATPRSPVSYSLTPWAQPLPPRGYRGDSARLQVLRPELARPSTGTVQISGPLFCWVLPIS